MSLKREMHKIDILLKKLDGTIESPSPMVTEVTRATCRRIRNELKLQRDILAMKIGVLK